VTRLVGINHVALEVGDIEDALAFYGQFFEFSLHGRSHGAGWAVEIRPGPGLDFHDPWGDYVRVVQYDQVQFTKAERVQQGMGLDLGKTDGALAELRSKGLA
jgi:lactoylglutathione lyase